MLEVQSITRHYGELKAVDDVSFSIERGEIAGLLGHNGAGKTTIMKMLSGYLEPDSGSIIFQGSSISNSPEILQRELGYLPENLPIYPELSVASYLDYAAELKGLTGDAKRKAIRGVIESIELGDKLLSPIATLSRGMKQRVGVAQAIIGSPSVLILDEPTNGLDPTQTEQMRQVIRNISESATVILSTHIMQEVEALCDRALIIRQGRLAIDARLNELTEGNHIALHTSASMETVSNELKSNDWFLGISERSDNRPEDNNDLQGDRLNQLVLQLSGDTDIRKRMAECARLLVTANVPVMGLSCMTQDLQSLFVEVNSAQHTPSRTASDNVKEVDHVA